MLLLLLSACKPKGVCSLAYTYNGLGQASELLGVDSVVIPDLSMARLVFDVSCAAPEKEEKVAVGATVILYESGTETIEKGAIVDLDGQLRVEADTGLYDVSISYTFFNTIHLKNIKLKAGETKTIKARLGRSGSEYGDVLEVDFAEL